MTETQRKVYKDKDMQHFYISKYFLHLGRREVLTIDNHFLTSFIKYVDGSMDLIIDHNHKF